MKFRQAKLSAEDLQKYAKLETSYQHWAVQHTQLCIQAKAALDQVSAMQNAKNQILDESYKAAGIDPHTIQELRISMVPETKEGRIDVVCAEETTNMSNGVPTQSEDVAKPNVSS